MATSAPRAFFLVLLVVAPLVLATVAETPDEQLKQMFEDYKTKFEKSYDSATEEAMRFELFKASMAKIEAGNSRNGAPIFGLSWMADRLPEEGYFRGFSRRSQPSPSQPSLDSSPHLLQLESSEELPPVVNWKLTPAVSPVKNQGQCGSCWAFSAVETIESHYYLHQGHENMVEFSAQQVASCTPYTYGCGGGDPTIAYEYLMSSKGLASAFFYPYTQSMTPADACNSPNCTKTCKHRKVDQVNHYNFYIGPAAHVKGYHYATPPCFDDSCQNQDLERLARAVANEGPVSVCVNADQWSHYTGGVMTAAACGGSGMSDIDHCVQLVGYNTTAQTPYWIVRNQWAENWGVDGYIYLEFGNNTCGLANEATIPKLEAKYRSNDNRHRRLQQMRRQAMGLPAEDAAAEQPPLLL